MEVNVDGWLNSMAEDYYASLPEPETVECSVCGRNSIDSVWCHFCGTEIGLTDYIAADFAAAADDGEAV